MLLISVTPFWILPIECNQGYADKERQKGDDLLKKIYILIFFVYKKYSRRFQIEPLMADGLPWRCFYFFSGPRQWYLLCSQRDSHKSLSFYLKYLKLCSEDEQSF